VQGPPLVSVRQREEQLSKHLEAPRDVPDGERRGIARVQPLDHRLERLALDELHHEEELAVLVDAHVVNRHDARVIELADDADLVDEPQHVVVTRPRQEPLARHLAADVAVFDERDLAHAARAERLHRHVARSARRLEPRDALGHLEAR